MLWDSLVSRSKPSFVRTMKRKESESMLCSSLDTLSLSKQRLDWSTLTKKMVKPVGEMNVEEANGSDTTLKGRIATCLECPPFLEMSYRNDTSNFPSMIMQAHNVLFYLYYRTDADL